jgi:hypothetical protein
MATPNNFKVTDAIGSTDNFAGAEVKFLHNLIRTILQRGTILYQRIDNAATGRIDITMERPGWTAATLQTAIRDMGDSVGVNNKSVSLSVVAETELKLDNS